MVPKIHADVVYNVCTSSLLPVCILSGVMHFDPRRLVFFLNGKMIAGIYWELIHIANLYVPNNLFTIVEACVSPNSFVHLVSNFDVEIGEFWGEDRI